MVEPHPVDTAAPARQPGLLAPLRGRDFRLLWSGMAVSLFGDGVFLVALAWQVYELSNAPAALSMVGTAMSLPHVVLLLVGGVVSDRFDRRRVMIAADLARAACLAVMAALALTGALQLWHLFPLIAVYGAANAFFGPAFDAIVPDVVPAELYTQANALEQLARPAAVHLAGPALGGALIAVLGTGGAFLFDTVTFLASALAVAAVRPGTRSCADRAPGGSLLADVREGFAFVRRHVWLWGTFAAATLAYLLFKGPSEVLLPYLVKNHLGGGAGDLGLVFAFGGVGAVGAAVVVGRRGLPRRAMTFTYGCWALATLAIAGYGAATAAWQAMAAGLVFNAFETAGTVVWLTIKQHHVPRHLLGRVSSLDWFISIGLVPLSYALTAPVSAVLGVRTTLVAAGALGALVTIAFLLLPGMRALDRHRAGPGAARDTRPRGGAAPAALRPDLVSLEAGRA